MTTNRIRSDRRYVRADDAICEALKELLKAKPLDAITMSELARAAGISRSTLYSHFDNVMDAYAKLVQNFYMQSQTLSEHFACEACREGKEVRPFCDCLRNAQDYKSVVRDGRFLQATLASDDALAHSETASALTDAGVPVDIAEAIVVFQMSGCYAVATSKFGRTSDWSRYQEAIDLFVKGGMHAMGVKL